MSNTRIVPAVGDIDGINVVFYVSEPYVPGSTAYILNGKIYSQYAARGGFNLFGFFESDPDAGQITVDFAPSIGSTVQILYWDRKPTVPPLIEQLVGTIDTVQILYWDRKPTVPPLIEQLVGTIDTVDELIGVVSE
jgi:hypothetical protein